MPPRVERVRAHAGRVPGSRFVLVGNDPLPKFTSAARRKRPLNSACTARRSRRMLRSQPKLFSNSFASSMRGRSRRHSRAASSPRAYRFAEILLAVAPEKDVDGFHPCNVGLLSTGRPGLRPCTPAGVIQILKRYRDSDSREKRGRARAQRHCRQADGDASAAGECDGHHLPLEDARSAWRVPRRGHPRCRDRQTRHGDSRLHPARGRGGGCRHQQGG